VLIAAGDEDPEPGVRVGRRPMRQTADPERLPAEAGLNRFVVPLLYPGVQGPPEHPPAGSTAIPVPPGSYTVHLSLGEIRLTVPATVLPDPRSAATSEDYQAQFALLLGIRETVAALYAAVARVRHVRDQLTAWVTLQPMSEAALPVRQTAMALIERLTACEEQLVQPRLTDRSGELASSHFPIQLTGKLESLASMVAGCDAAPTAQAQVIYSMLTKQATSALQNVHELLTEDLRALNQKIRDADLPTIQS